MFNVYPVETALGWRVVGLVNASTAAEKMAAGEFRDIHDESGQFLGYQMLGRPGKALDHSSNPTSCSITAREVQMNAGCFGSSMTLPLSRAEHAEVPEDAVERAITKVRQGPHPASRIDDGSGQPVYGDRAVRVYPKA